MLSYVFACLSLKYLVSPLTSLAPAGSSCKPDSRCYMMLCSVHGWFADQHIYSQVPYWFRNSSYWNCYTTMKGCPDRCLYPNSHCQECYTAGNSVVSHNSQGYPTMLWTRIRSDPYIFADCRNSIGTYYSWVIHTASHINQVERV